MTYAFDFSALADYGPEIVDGVLLTLRLALITTTVGLVFGSAAAIARVHGSPAMQRAVGFYVEAIRNTPLIIQTFWLFFGLATIGVPHSRILGGGDRLGDQCRLLRDGNHPSRPSIRRERPARSGGLPGLSRWQVISSIEFPQAVERVYPALVSQFVLMMLATSIMSQISVEELTGVGYRIQSDTFRGFEVYLVIAAIYVALSLALRALISLVALAVFTRRRRLGTSL